MTDYILTGVFVAVGIWLTFALIAVGIIVISAAIKWMSDND
jgi:hypothetical protein